MIAAPIKALTNIPMSRISETRRIGIGAFPGRAAIRENRRGPGRGDLPQRRRGQSRGHKQRSPPGSGTRFSGAVAFRRHGGEGLQAPLGVKRHLHHAGNSAPGTAGLPAIDCRMAG